jgi:hypothetical protein
MMNMIQLEKIIQTLIVNGTLTEQPGLFYGKTGIAVFFFHYARQTGNELFQDYTAGLIEEIRKQITVTVSARYDVGLAGIGVGFEYMLQNDFLEAEDDDIFEDFDARMYRVAMYEPYPDLSLEGGLTGWGRYFVYRLRGKGHKDSKLHEALTHIANEILQKIAKNTIPEDEQPDVYRFFHDLTTLPEYSKKFHNSLKKCKKWECIYEPDVSKLFPYTGDLQRLYVCQNYFNMDLSKEMAQEWEKWEEMDNNSLINMGLLNGWTKEGLLHLTFLNKNNISWLNLL